MLRLSGLAAVSLAVLLAAFSFGQNRTPVLPETPYAYSSIELPSYLDVRPIRDEDNTPATNPITDAGATLGRVLFYDTRLSANGAVSCGSCHLQDRGFSDPAQISVGFEGGLTGRNSMGLAFARYYDSGHFFWDERAETLEEQVLMPIQDDVEMGMTLEEVAARLEATGFYPDLFTDAFGTPEVTSERVARALSQFVRSVVSPGSPYDAARQAQGGPPGRPLAGLTEQENAGLALFFGRGRCAQCHRGDLFVGDEARNNGLDATLTDVGAGGGRFKTGSLRNIALTAPYMHDGRFATLGAVVDHYSTGIQDSPDLDARLRGPNGRPIRPNFTAAERAALVAFLETLTDPTLADDPRWSDPFAIDTAAEDPGAPARAARIEMAGPNPVRGTTAFRVEASGETTVGVYDARGRRVAVVFRGAVRGVETVRWDASGLAAGTYVVRLRGASGAASRTVTVAR